MFLLNCVTAETAVNFDICHSLFSKRKKERKRAKLVFFFPLNRAYKGVVKHDLLPVEGDNSFALNLVILPSKSLITASL